MARIFAGFRSFFYIFINIFRFIKFKKYLESYIFYGVRTWNVSVFLGRNRNVKSGKMTSS